MRLSLAISTLAAVLAFSDASAGQRQGADVVSEDFCVVPVKNGRPTEADHGAVFRMVFWVDVIPHLAQVYIEPSNRGGRWTIDREGAFRPFEGPFPTRGLSTQRQWIVDGTGRVVGANQRNLFVIDPPNDTFRHVLRLENREYFGKLKYEPHSGTIYVKTSKGLHELRDETLVRSPYAVEASKLGLMQLQPPHYLPSIGAHLFEARDGRFALRYRGGNWQVVHTLRCGGRCRNYPPEVVELEREELVVVKTAKEIFAIDVKDPKAPEVTEVYWEEGNLARKLMRYSPETDTFIIYDDEPFLRLAEDPAATSVNPGDSWLLRVTRHGIQPVPGLRIVPSSPLRGTYSTYFRDLPGRGQALVWARDGLALFDGESTRSIPDSGPDRIGPSTRAFTLKALDRVFIVSSLGLYELTEDNRLERVETPFDPGGYPPMEFIDAPHMKVAIALSRDGVYTLDQDGAFRRVPGGEAVRLGLLSKGRAVLPNTGEVLIQGSEALHLLRRAPCSP